jgi:hypothetical protein
MLVYLLQTQQTGYAQELQHDVYAANAAFLLPTE